MNNSKNQQKLFNNVELIENKAQQNKELKLSKKILKAWQNRVFNYQSKLFKGGANIHCQGSLFSQIEKTSLQNFSPLDLTPLPMSFWRSSDSPHHGPAIYLVMDRLENCDSYILLYIGETIAAERRWKGEHDCKTYLAAYAEALASVGIKNQLSIRFWSDVPEDTRSRRKLEQQLIQIWLPPFNKETRTRWNTPFTSELK